MNEIEKIQEGVIVDAKKETENAMYTIRYQYMDTYDNKQLLAISVSVGERMLDETDGMPTYTNIGTMDYNNGQISMSGFPYSEKTSTYMDEFTAIVEEIKLLIK